MKVKFCGLGTEADVKHAAALGCAAIGFVFVPGSRRYLSIEQALPLIALAKQGGIVTVALVANFKSPQVAEIIKQCQPDVIQFHGTESAAFCEQFKHRYWKAIPMLDTTDWQANLKTYKEAEMLLLDAYGRDTSGGSGTAFKWFEFPESERHKLILAGGLNADNLTQAIDATGTRYIDISSGIESMPGLKSHAKMQQITQQITQLNNIYDS